MKSPDRTAIPLCHRDHMDWHDSLGFFRGWGRLKRRLWADMQIAAMQRRYRQLTGIDVRDAATAA